jgi:hypothetical protein
LCARYCEVRVGRRGAHAAGELHGILSTSNRPIPIAPDSVLPAAPSVALGAAADKRKAEPRIRTVASRGRLP